MCGIYGGAVNGASRSADYDCFVKLGAELEHRGPDESSEYLKDSILIGFHRLSIVDQANGHQPYSSDDGSVILVGNGEVYNYKEIKSQLTNIGYFFKTESDIECLLYLYLEYGAAFVNKLRGMFAFAIYDSRSGEMILGRDRLGEKPLYYAETENGVWFSSESTALIKSGIKDFTISGEGLISYLKYGFVNSNNSLVNGISQVEPGSLVIVNIRNFKISKEVYWSLKNFRDSKVLNGKQLFLEEMHQIEKDIFQGEAAVGLALSGGIDSSFLALIAKKQSKKINTITIGYNSKNAIDESESARRFSSEIGYPCTVRNISPTEVGSRFGEMVYALDEPIADPSSFSYFILGEEAKKLGLKVLLTGHGPDELFWGYNWVGDLYRSVSLRQKMFRGEARFRDYLTLPKFKGNSVGNFIDESKTFFGTLDGVLDYFEDLKDAFNRNYSVRMYSRKPRFRDRIRIIKKLGLISTKKSDEMESITLEEVDYSQLIVREILIKSYLQINGLAQIDRLFMANSVEGRSLLVDYKLVEIALSDFGNRPSAVFSGKSSFLKYVSENVPDEIISRKKQGFTPPVREWYLNIFKGNKQIFCNSKLVEDGVLSEACARILQKPLTFSRRPRLLWLELATLEIWYRKAFYDFHP